MGTPAYMAPEQHRGEVADSRSDLFAYCLALYEALAGEHPFFGATRDELARNVTDGRLVGDGDDGAGTRRIPRHLRAVLLQGLRADPDERPESMDAVLAVLRRDPVVRRRRSALAAGVAGLVGLAAFGLLRQPEQPALCTGASDELAAVWSVEEADRIRTAFADSGHRLAAESAEQVIRILDEYAAEWTAMHTDACLQTRVRGSQSERVLDLRNTCLERRRQGLASLVAGLTGSDVSETAVDKSVRAAYGLDGIANCGDIAALSATVPPPDAPAERAVVEAITRELADARTQEALGDYRRSESTLRALVERADTVDHRPTRAEVHYALGRLLVREYRHAESVTHLQRAELDADAGRHDRVRFLSVAELVYAVGYGLGKADEGRVWAERARAVLTRLDGDESLEADLLSYLGQLCMTEEDFACAADHHRRALTLREQLGERDRMAISHHNLALALAWKGDSEAIVQYRRSYELFRELFGKSHVLTATALMGEATTYLEQGDPAAALPLYREVLAIRRAALGEHSPLMGQIYNNIGIAFDQLGRHSEARSAYRDGLAAIGDASVDETARVYRNLASSYVSEGKLDEAREALSQSLQLESQEDADANGRAAVLSLLGEIALQGRAWDDARGYFSQGVALWQAKSPDHHQLPDFWDGLGRAWRGAGQPARALTEHRKALALRQKIAEDSPSGRPGGDPPAALDTLAFMAQAHLDTGQAGQAREVAERAVALVGTESPAVSRGLAHFVLARAIWRLGKERERARELAERALGDFTDAGASGEQMATEVRAWLERPQ